LLYQLSYLTGISTDSSLGERVRAPMAPSAVAPLAVVETTDPKSRAPFCQFGLDAIGSSHRPLWFRLWTLLRSTMIAELNLRDIAVRLPLE
jgi:hypothetical protein